MEVNVLGLISELNEKPKTINVLSCKKVVQEDGTIIVEQKMLDNDQVIKMFVDIYGTQFI